jgi:hypothetical protein
MKKTIWTGKTERGAAITLTCDDEQIGCRGLYFWIGAVLPGGKKLGGGFRINSATEIGFGTQGIILPAAMVAEITAARDAAQAEYDSRPAVVEAHAEKALRSERGRLASEIAGALDEREITSRRAHESECGDSLWQKLPALSAKIEAAQQALRAFDAAHPELRAKIDAERKARDEELLQAGLNA